MSAGDIPMWALDEACNRSGLSPWSVIEVLTGAHSTLVRCTVRCLAAHIAKHEQPPVDPDLIEAREILEARGWVTANNLAMLRLGQMDGCDAMKVVLDAIKRGRELARGQ